MSRRALPRALVGGVLFPLWKSLRGDPVRAQQSELEEREGWSKQVREAHRAELLATLLESARREVPVWRREFGHVGSIDAHNARDLLLEVVPTDKQRYRELGSDAYSEAARPWISSSTGGSTGEPFFFRCDSSAASWRRANTARCLDWLGMEAGDPNAVLWGFALGASRTAELKATIRQVLSNQLALSSFAMDAEVLDSHLARLRAFRPRLLLGYPSALAVLAEHALRRGQRVEGLESILSSGEKVFDSQKEVLYEAFGVPVYERYGSREFANLAHECPRREGMHLLDDDHIVEILDVAGNPVPVGEVGELTVTDLRNHAMPFLRYRTGDLAVASAETCSCGRMLPLLERIEGRSFDVIRTPQGKRVGGYFWTWLSRAVPGVHAFQVYQDRLEHVELRVVPGPGWTREGAHTLEGHARETLGSGVVVVVRELREIPLTPSGKHRFILSELGGVE